MKIEMGRDHVKKCWSFEGREEIGTGRRNKGGSPFGPWVSARGMPTGARYANAVLL